MHTSDVETQALTHAQSIGFAISFVDGVDLERRQRQLRRCLRLLGIDGLLDCEIHSASDLSWLHLSANDRLQVLCPNFDTAPIQAYLSGHRRSVRRPFRSRPRASLKVRCGCAVMPLT
jgi:hypothetical protein